LIKGIEDLAVVVDEDIVAIPASKYSAASS